MTVHETGAVQSMMQNPGAQRINNSPAEAHDSFKTWLNDAIGSVNESRAESSQATEAMARGEDVDLHNVMLTAQKASIQLETTVQVRDRVIEAYQEVMRMQV
ncbi:flagellar hook-basal body complex protein FliE [Alkalicoccus chagannorensis]|uniref:flagellar hook-basal body complex protein FliE n=1 Tax=Alkalicoccus chagannorensis TaxID=427072 RepID=UPI000404C6DF|nr:flagellar hook-basal body complex protein FliE [Alkalicoccus chagannorensis]